VGHEQRQEAVTVAGRLGCEPRAVGREVEQAAAAPRPDGQLLRVYGKMFRMASRIRPKPPPAGADS
jgi:hypothetical protein